MLKFNDNNIYSGYIKQLLSSFNLPQCPIGKKDFSQNSHYIENNGLYFYNKDKNISKLVANYKENDKILNITKNLEIRSNVYDSYTHEYLGDYLRYIRDYKKLNLMSMYNCFSNVTANVDFTNFNSKDSSYTIFCFPVKFNQKYTIALDWHGTIEVCCGFYKDGKRFVSDTYDGDIEKDTYQKFSGLRFSDPVIYDKLKLSDLKNYDYDSEKCLKMYLKVSTECKSSIVVLEGDYRQCAELIIDGNRQVLAHKPILYYHLEEQDEVLYDSNSASSNFDYRSRLQLLSSNSGEIYLLADRLVEYLSNQVITPLDPVIDNIRRLQLKALKEINSTTNKPYDVKFNHYGIWDENLRKFLYAYIINNGLQNEYTDLLAYLDKDIEKTFDIEVINGEENEVWQIR